MVQVHMAEPSLLGLSVSPTEVCAASLNLEIEKKAFFYRSLNTAADPIRVKTR